MKKTVAIIKLENSVLWADLSTFISITSPSKNYTQIEFSEEPELREGEVSYAINESLGSKIVSLILPYAPSIVFIKQEI